MNDDNRELVLAVTKSLRDLSRDGTYPTHEQIESELARRLLEAQDMFGEERMARVKAEGDATEYRHRLVACGAW